jgi:Mrp family chromosome partitioning ATPase
VLAGRRSIVDVLRTRAPGPVKYVCPGAPPEDPGTLLATPAVGEAVRDLAHMFDVVLVLTPPVLDAADAQQLATLTGGVVVSVRAGRTRASQLDRALETLRSVGADVVGTLVRLQGVRRPARPSKAPTPDEEPTAVHQLRAERQASLG